MKKFFEFEYPLNYCGLVKSIYNENPDNEQ